MHQGSRILLMDTSGRVGAVGLATDAGLVAATHLPGTLRHAAELMPALEGLLQGQGWPADSLTDVFLTVGPGSFTGLRLGISVARTFAWAAGLRIVTLPTLDVLARNALAITPPPPHVAVLLDAKRGQVFAACFSFDDGGYAPIAEARLVEPGPFLSGCPRPLAVLGEGVPMHEETVAAAGVEVLPPELWPGRAEHVFALGIEQARAGRFTPAGDLVPLYIRRPEMEERWEQRQAAGRAQKAKE